MIPWRLGVLAANPKSKVPTQFAAEPEIVLHVGGKRGPICKKQTATVFWFDEAKMETSVGGTYAYTNNGVNAELNVQSPNVAINLSAKATLKPVGLNVTAPQIDPLRIGIVQNTRSRNRRTATFVVDHMSWLVPPPATIKVPTYRYKIFERPVPLEDTDQLSSLPLYPAFILNRPLPSGAPTTSNDTPSFHAGAIAAYPAIDKNGRHVGDAVYLLQDLEIDIKFRTWAVAYNIITKEVVPLRNTNWEINVSGSSPGTVDVHGDRRASDCPILVPPISNDTGTWREDEGFWNTRFTE